MSITRDTHPRYGFVVDDTEGGYPPPDDIGEEIERLYIVLEEKFTPRIGVTKDKVPWCPETSTKTSYKARLSISTVIKALQTDPTLKPSLIPGSIGCTVLDADTDTEEDSALLERVMRQRLGDDAYSQHFYRYDTDTPGHSHTYYLQQQMCPTGCRKGCGHTIRPVFRPGARPQQKEDGSPTRSGNDDDGDDGGGGDDDGKYDILADIKHICGTVTLPGLPQLRDLLQARIETDNPAINLFAYKQDAIEIKPWTGMPDNWQSLAVWHKIHEEEGDVELLHPLLGAQGYITVIAAGRGHGKTSLVAAIFADLTRQGKTVLWFSQDENPRTIADRFKAYRADFERVIVYTGMGTTRPFKEELEKVIGLTGAVAIMLDTGDKYVSAAYAGDLQKSWVNDQACVDRVMTDLRKLTETYNILPVYCTHTRKSISVEEKKEPDEESISGSHKIGANSDYCLTMRGVKEGNKIVATEIRQDRMRIPGTEPWSKRVVISDTGEITITEIKDGFTPPPSPKEAKFRERCRWTLDHVERELPGSEHLRNKTLLKLQMRELFGGGDNAWEKVIGYLFKHDLLSKRGDNGVASRIMIAEDRTPDAAREYLDEILQTD